MISPGARGMLSGGGSATADTVTTTGDITAGDDILATDDVSGATVTSPVFRTATAADVQFQRNSTEVARLSATGMEIAVGKRVEIYNVGGAGVANYERTAFYYTGNTFTVLNEKGGTGSDRGLQVLSTDGSGLRVLGSGIHTIDGSSSGATTLQVHSDTIGMNLAGKVTTSVTVPALTVFNNPSGSNFSASSGTQTLFRALSTVNQTGTAAFVGLESDVTPTAVGSGTVMGLSVKRGGTEVLGIDCRAALSNDANTVMFLTYHSSGVVKHARVTLAADVAGQRFLQVAT